VFATFFALPHSRLDSRDGSIVMFDEPSAGSAVAINTWFYVAETTGFDFVYPNKQAMSMANCTQLFRLQATNVEAQ
jgi:hypothetical protein